MARKIAPEAKPSRTWLWVVLGMASVLLVILIGIRLYFDSDRLKRILTPVLADMFRRPVDMQDVGLTFWGGPGASVEGLEVGERAGFGNTPFVKAERAALSLEFWPLLTGEARLGEAVIENPALSVVIDENGKANYADLTAPERKGGVVGLPVGRMAISGGTLRCENRQTGSVTRIEGIDYRLHARMEPGRLALDGDLSVARVETVPRGGKATTFAGLSLSHRLFLETGKDALTVASLRVVAGPLEVEAAGQVTQLSDVPHISLEAKEQALDMARVAAYLAESGMSAEGVEVKGEGRVTARIDGVWNAEADPPVYPAVSGRISLKNGWVKDPELLVPIENIQAALALEKNILTLSSLTARAGRSDLSVSGRLAGLPDEPFLTFRLASKVLNVDEIVPPIDTQARAVLFEKGGSAWGLTASAYAAPPGAAPDETSTAVWLARMLDADGALEIGELTNEGTVYRNFRANVKVRKQVLRLEDVRAEVYGGRLEAQIEVDARPPSGRLPMRASIVLDRVQANDVVQAYLKWALPISGEMGLSLTMTGTVDSALEVVEEEIDAEGTAGVKQGKIVNWQVLKQAAASVNALGFLNGDEISLRDLEVPFRVADGRLRLDGTRAVVADMAGRLSGSVGLDGTLDCTLDVDVPASRLNAGGLNLGRALGALFGGKDAVVPLRVVIGGTADRPQVKAEIQPAGKVQVREKRKEAREKLDEKGRGLIKKLFSR